MSNYIVALLQTSTWITIFISCFFFGLIFLIFVIFNSFGHHSLDKDTHSGHEVGHDGHQHLSVDHDLSHDDLHSGDFHGKDLHLEDFGGKDHISTESGDVGVISDSRYIEKSNYTMGNIAVFFLIFGQIGWLFIDNLSDFILILAIGVAVIVTRLFGWILSNYAKTVIVPVFPVARGDIGTVVSDVTFEKKGIVHVRKKDGMIITIVAKGAFPHDSFERGETGYVWDSNDNQFTITHGHQDQMKIVKNNKKLVD